MDLHLPGDGGITATSTITRAGTAGAVLVLTMNADSAQVRQALHAGAHGYLLKDAQPEAIIRAIVSVHQGQLVFDARVAGFILSFATEPQVERAFPTLTQREYEVLERLERLARGLRNDAIAARLGISIKPCRTPFPRSSSNSVPATGPTLSSSPETPDSAPHPEDPRPGHHQQPAAPKAPSHPAPFESAKIVPMAPLAISNFPDHREYQPEPPGKASAHSGYIRLVQLIRTSSQEVIDHAAQICSSPHHSCGCPGSGIRHAGFVLRPEPIPISTNPRHTSSQPRATISR